jgi:hypothetical protein
MTGPLTYPPEIVIESTIDLPPESTRPARIGCGPYRPKCREAFRVAVERRACRVKSQTSIIAAHDGGDKRANLSNTRG